ncbi:ABC transporter substrate-binding protein [Actinokineospora iranica]|uniref:Iron complex transport system substrate-binding protein n=1 Tax=Actinokineospora iranica TaxID=1271860 RepID=A0A1G6KAY2_9PSEU|nr:ABC transporter substrate-binding protein [Actinokineospora iranica]SDC28150.1 iron complex transport system substrate-binding protein [Actinokineospora iranica]
MTQSAVRRLVAATLLIGALTGCATREQPAETAPPPASASFPVTLTAPGGAKVTLAKRPEKIVSLSSSATEGLFAVGAGKQVVAVDDQSTFPAEAPRTALSGLTVNVEALGAHSPDLVVAAGDAGDLVAGLGRLSVPVLILPSARSLDDVYGQLDLLGKATGHPAEAADLVTRMRADIDKIVRDTPKKPLSYYHELDTELYSVTSKTFIGSVYGLFGLTNVADAADVDAGGYPKLSTEYVIKANPALVFLADTKCCAQTPQTVAARPGWDTVDAVRRGNVVVLDDDIASRWGPRVVDLVRAVADAVTKAG